MESYGIPGRFVSVNVPSYSVGIGNAVRKVTALVVVDLERKHLVLTSDLGSEMLFQIHQRRGDVNVIPETTLVSKAQ